MNRTYIQHYKSLFTLGIPIVIGQVGVIILGFADTLMIGHHSTNELAAASFVNNMFTLAIIFATGFSYGLTPIVGSLFGRGETSVVGRMLKIVFCQCPAGSTAYLYHVGALSEYPSSRATRRIASTDETLFYRTAHITIVCPPV